MNDGTNLPPVLKPSIWKRKIEIPRKYYVAFFGLLVVLVAYGSGCLDSKKTRINKWLEFHQMARLPKSATNINFYQWNGLGTGETYISFQIHSNDLAIFITNSPGLSEGKLEIFNVDHQHLPYPSNATNQIAFDNLDRSHAYFRNHEMFPDWFDPTITNRGRKYILQRGPNSEVYFNELTGKIYLRTIKG